MTGSELERTVGALLTTGGSALLMDAKADSGSDRPDFAFYLEGRETELGIILVEVKRLAGPNPQGRLRDASKQLARYVAQTNAGLGLIVYESDGFPARPKISEPLIVAIALDRLEDELRQRPLDDLIRRLRNEAIHGS